MILHVLYDEIIKRVKQTCSYSYFNYILMIQILEYKKISKHAKDKCPYV